MKTRPEMKADFTLCVVIDKSWAKGRTLTALAGAAIEGGATILQYRNKSGSGIEFYSDCLELLQTTRPKGVPLIVNDRADIALAVQADGVHIGREDLPVSVVRSLVGKTRIVGGSIREIGDLEAMKGADYLGVGAMFRTETHPGYGVLGPSGLERIRSATTLPLVGIGGIDRDNLGSVIRAGADGVAVISAALGHADVRKAVKALSVAIAECRNQGSVRNQKRRGEGA